MNKRNTSLFVLLLAFAAVAPAQPGPGRNPDALPKSSLSGQVYDADLNTPVEYATVVLYSLRDSQQVTGTVTDKTGRFELTGLRPGRYYVQVTFIGYRSRTISDIQLAPGAQRDLGRTTLRQTAVAVEGVEATAERPKLEYRIDKKVVDVARQPTPPTGSAVDVLENVPSVKVDVEGNVSLRGSGSFTVLVDGRPSMLEPSEALQQIPASTIDNIEIITNPSAKYDPEGVSGIINVVLRKQRTVGVSGIVNLKGGLEGSYGGDFLLGYRTGPAALTFGADYGRRSFPGKAKSESWTRDSTGETTFVNSEGTSARSGQPRGLRGGLDLKLGRADQLGVQGRFGQRGMSSDQTATYTERDAAGTRSYQGSGSSSHSGQHYSGNLNYLHSFGRQGHELRADVNLGGRSGSEDEVTERKDSTGKRNFGRRTAESGPSNRLTFKLDYTLPLREKDKFEAGYQGRLNRSRDSNSVWELNPAADSYEYQKNYSNVADFADDVHALYGIYNGSLSRFGFQLGVRGEYTGRSINLVPMDSSFDLTAWDIFPTLHFSYALPGEQQFMASYTRRIERPHGWDLQPTISWWGAYNVRQGNPALKPEYIDSYEAAYQLPFLGASRLSLEGYYRVTHDVIERVQRVYQDSLLLSTSANVGTDYSLGTELQLDFRPSKWFGLNVTSDIYKYRLEGSFDTTDFSASSLNWEVGGGPEFRLPTETRVQLNFRYEGPSVTAQGREEASLRSSAAVRQQLFSRRLTLSLQVFDLFRTAGHERTSQDQDFYSHFRFSRDKTPAVSFGATWNFNNFKLDRRQETEENGNGEDTGESEQ